MRIRCWTLCAALAVLAEIVAPGAVTQAKPPDLPVSLDVECQDTPEHSGNFTLDLELFGGKITLQLQAPATPALDAAPCLDSFGPVILEALSRDLLAHWNAAQAEAQKARGNNAPKRVAGRKAPEKNPADLDEIRLKQAQAMFLIGERCLKKGDLDKARTCYQEAHLLHPMSRYGRQAIERLSEIDAAILDRDADAEEQEQPAPQSRESNRHSPRAPLPSRGSDEENRRREMLRTTVPLGLVPYDLITSEGTWTLYGKPRTQSVTIRQN